ncbi:type IV pili twitching motility protein PilT [Candidatus Cerribacteria bacterium 'Amazon FNV 2010 28 9']|uniref:Type IV pili twitching motility protein PilT n=1 Tax=Candidatus Cerribacteria bacterium 'Amazon FNV 2010 28 9' TaxID=2081795 RepID=A0A317JN75_9BACT|nr:MAG: type IV pili twitching motility protein PilT [Candidatus Cerribacteria bacterium 'Amazon FNV 2010 28 9']
MSMTMEQMMELAVSQQASDIHIVVGSPPMLRVHGDLIPIQGEAIVDGQRSQELVFSILSQELKDQLLVNKEVDFSYQFKDQGRFRVNTYYVKETIAGSFRLIPTKIKTIEELKLPSSFHQFSTLKQGFVLVTGPTGQGKSSTLAAIIEEINQTRAEHILTIEDPIEFIYAPVKSLISQRELHADTHSWEVALKSALREDPNIVLVGEMRDYETIAAALTVAETGHLVFATLHTNSASQTVDRIIDVFPEHQQGQIRMQLANTLQAIVSQRLIKSIKGGRVAASEVMIANSAVRNIIREGKTFQLDNVILTSSEAGMISLDNSLAKLVNNGEIAYEEGLELCIWPDQFNRLIKTI